MKAKYLFNGSFFALSKIKSIWEKVTNFKYW